MFEKFRKNKTKQKNIEDQITLGINVDNLSKHSEAGSEFVKAFTGKDNQTGQNLQKGLWQIKKYKLNQDYYDSNIKQQAGYSAEVLDVARKNSKAILNGDDVRFSRVDDVPGHKVNETPFDIAGLNVNGKEIYDLSGQVKFLDFVRDQNGVYRVDVQKYTKKIAGLVKVNGIRYSEKYPEGTYIVPKDAYFGVKKELKFLERQCQNQLDYARRQGNFELQNKYQAELDYVKKVDNNLKQSEVTANDAILARLEPEKLTAREITGLGHQAGINYAKSMATIKGTIAFAQCMSKVMNGEMSVKDASKEVSAEVVKGAGLGYVTGHANTALASVMRNSSKEVLRKMGQSSVPAQIVTFTASVIRIVNDNIEGKITDEECFYNITKSGVSIAGTFRAGELGAKAGENLAKAINLKYGGALGQAVGFVGGPVCAIVASVVASVVINATLDYAITTLMAPGIARQERLEIEQLCDLLHQELEIYRENFERIYVKKNKQLLGIFGSSLKNMAVALDMGDADLFINGANAITNSLGGKTQFNNLGEFEQFLDSNEDFEL